MENNIRGPHKKGNRKRGSRATGQLPNFILFSLHENRKIERVKKKTSDQSICRKYGKMARIR